MIRSFFLFIFLCTGFLATAQQGLQQFTPSILFDKGSWEFKSYQNLYSQQSAFGDSPLEKVNTERGRETFFTSINQFSFGLNDRINFGLDVWVKHVNLENGDFRTRTAISGIGPRIKIAPFRQLPRFSIQSTFLFPLADDLEGRAPDAEQPFLFLETDRSLWLSQLFYDVPISSKWQLFFQQAFWYNIVRESFRENNFLQTQTSVFVSYFPTSRWTIFGMTEYFPTHYNDSNQSGELSFSYFVQSGAGLKYQLIPNLLELETLYTNFWAGSAGNGAGYTINFGIRVIRQ